MPLGVLPILISSCSSWYSLHILLSTWCDSWNLTPKNCINEQLLVFEDLEVPSHKTKFIVNYYNQMENTKKVLLCDGGCIHEKLKLATQNLHYVNVLPSVVRSTTQSFLIYYYFLDFDFKKIWIIPKKIVKHQCLKFLTVIHRVHFDNSQVYLNPKSHGVLYFEYQLVIMTLFLLSHTLSFSILCFCRVWMSTASCSTTHWWCLEMLLTRLLTECTRQSIVEALSIFLAVFL